MDKKTENKVEKKPSEFRVLVKDLIMHPFMTELRNYRNDIYLSGFILRKPRFYKHEKVGTESCAFMLYQIVVHSNEVKVESFNCITYVTPLVEQFRKQKNAFFVAMTGKFRHSFKIDNNYVQVVEMETMIEFDKELVD